MYNLDFYKNIKYLFWLLYWIDHLPTNSKIVCIMTAMQRIVIGIV